MALRGSCAPFLLLILAALWVLSGSERHRNGKGRSEVVVVEEIKDWKKLLRTRTNVLGLFAASEEHVTDFFPVFERVSDSVKGKGTLTYTDCSHAKKLCKTLRVKPQTYLLKHFQEGKFLKDYDRLHQQKSLLNFILDPNAEPPWSEDPIAKDVKHIDNPHDFHRVIGKERKPLLLMFYAPWCGHCNQLKPKFAAAATRLKKSAVLAAMDVDKPEAYGVRQEYNITGFPTLIYFEDGRMKYDYTGGRDEEGIIKWMKNPQPPSAEPEVTNQEPEWSEQESDVVHLTDASFDSFIASNPSVLVMFYAPWCGHCKAMKPHYTDAARIMKESGVNGVLAAVDATKTKLGERYNVQGFPTVKYFQDGELKYEYGYERTTDALVDFMRDPKEPPPPEKDWAEIPSSVLHLTDENFKSTLKRKKNSLVMFYAPWCGHCKAAKPHFTDAAEVFADDRKTAFAAVDCTKFTGVCTTHEVNGYPTIKYFSYGKNEFKYMGPRSTEGFIEFMKNPSAFAPFSRDEL